MKELRKLASQMKLEIPEIKKISRKMENYQAEKQTPLSSLDFSKHKQSIIS